MSRSNDSHVIVDLSVASSGSHDDDNDQEDNSQTTTSTTIEAIRPSTSSEDRQEPATAALLLQQQQQPLSPYQTVPEIINPDKRTNVLFSASIGHVKYKASVSAFTDPGDYIAIWSVSNHGDRTEVSARTVRFRLDTKIHVEKGYQLVASLDLRFEFVDRLKGADNTGSSQNIIETIDNSSPKPGTAFLFEMRPCDPEEEGQEQEQEHERDGPSILALPVTRRVDTPLELIPPSIREDFQKVYILATAVSQDKKTVVTISRKGRGVEFFLDLWDLNGYYYYSNNKEKDDLTKSRRPMAWIAFMIDGVEELDMSLLDVALSSNGELVTVFDTPRKLIEDGFSAGKFPLRVFQRKPTTTTITAASAAEATTVKQQLFEMKTPTVGGSGDKQAVTQSNGLEEVRYDKISPLFTFAGFAKFQHRLEQRSNDNRQSADPRKFVLVTCNGRCLEVYEARTGLKLLYTVSLAALSLNGDYTSYRLLMKNLQNSMFVWYVNTHKEISVWNWRTGRNVGYFPKGSTPVLSTDESLLAVFRDSLVCTYSTKNGQLQNLRTNIAWKYRENEYVTYSHVVLSRGNGRLAMLQQNDIQEDGDKTSELVRYVDMHYLEDIQETTVAIPLGSRLIHVLPSKTLGQQNAIGTAIVRTSRSIKLLDLEPTTTAAVCGPDCSESWRHGPKQNRDSFYDENQQCTFRFIMNDKKGLIRLARIWGKSESNSHGVILLELPVSGGCLGWTILQSRNQCYVFSKPDFDDHSGWSNAGFELWQLPRARTDRCTLLGVGDASETSPDCGRFICTHGCFHRWDGDDRNNGSRFGTSDKELSGSENVLAIWHRIEQYTDDFDTFPVTYKRAVAECIARHINKDPYPHDVSATKAGEGPPGTSFMWKIVLECVRSGNDALLLGVLGSNNHLGYWVPSPDEFSDNAEKDMIAHLIVEFKLPVAEILIDYCLARAHSTDPVLLEKLMISVPHLIPKHPDVALNIARRAAFLPVLNRDQVLQQAVYNGDQWRPGKFWVPVKSKLYEVIDQNPVFHRLNRLAIFDSNKTQDLKNQPGLLPVAAETVKKNADIKTNLYMAPFSLVWTIQGNEDGSKKAKKDGRLLTGQVIDKDQQLPAKTTEPAMPAKLTTVAGSGALFLRMIWHFVFPFDKVFIHSHYDDLQAYDNPAFSALMTYKWTRFARYFWFLRLSFQISYEFLVLVVTLFQLYGDEEQRADLVGGYITIIVLGYVLLHFEFQQMRRGIGRYFSSPYNYVDLWAYVIPMVSSCILIADSDQIVALRALSFSVVFIYIHFIFELRVFRNVCRVVTIVVNILSDIPAFFIILAIFTGDYGPVQTSLTNGHWTSQLMVSMFFFLTAVLMMNVVVALMNGVYTETILTVDQTWLKNRLDLIAGAENLSFFLPYFRNYFDYFPRWVYYTATDKEVEEYRKKYGLDEPKPRFVFGSEKDDEEEDDEVEEEVEEDRERDEEEEKAEEKKSSFDIAATSTTTTTSRDAIDTTLPSSSPETQDLVKALKTELDEIKDLLAVQGELWQAERKKQQERLDFQDQQHQKVEEMLKQMLLLNQRSG
ncbi:hypothetical protein KI688_007907 [Linnemannia hyalina]|uniref:Ion transport domain-containing protein n=1 Tax=Linnemannia hyalina TaxID=64524 RepID=A0A9P7XIN9_9FUNG|nr:hypothetical protein KI688_007907 [Linnemannia hyalina]